MEAWLFAIMQMSKTIGALEKEVGLWKARYEKASLTLMDTAEEVRRKGIDGCWAPKEAILQTVERYAPPIETLTGDH